MGPRTIAAAAIAVAVAPPGLAAPVPPAQDIALGRSVLKELIEINSEHAYGSTAPAKAIAARFLAAGFAPDDVRLLIPPDHPTKGNVVVRLHGTGKRRPILYIGHLDVVEARREDWTYDPYKLTEADGWYYGRGTIDMKGQDTAVIESLMRMKREGYVPDRDIIAAFTADEEAGGDDSGIDWLLKTHRDLIDAALVINPDSGEAGMKQGRKLYLGVQTAEKVYVTYALEARDKGGHSSRPTPANPIVHLAAAVARIGAYRFNPHFTDTTRRYFALRAVLETGQAAADMREAATGAPSPAALERLSSAVETNIVFRTTCVVTQFNGGQSESALPERAKAIVQCRMIPGETDADIQAQLRAVVNDPAVTLSVAYPADPSPESPVSPEVMGAVERVGKAMWPEVIVLPFMSAGASDSAFTRSAGYPSYGVDGMFDDLDDGRAHGRDERIGVEAFSEDLEFTYRVMRALTGG
ncbi:MAG: M20/M25/M40 family metallo-hydrolase [Caulobacteraceae bacterium]|nr:M20/M25/M40 family metallo-hydrolase [Caulobacteraceae bacterium]